MENKNNFEKLLLLNVNDKINVKKTGQVELKYLSWAWAYSEFKKVYPDFTYEIKKFNNLPYQETPLGLMVWTSITAAGETRDMWLSVMDGSNRSLKTVSYSYKQLNKKTNEYEEKFVNPANMNDINKTIMRCLVKNMAMFGLGLYIYAGEDLPEGEEDKPVKQPKTKITYEDMKNRLISAVYMEQLNQLVNEYTCDKTEEQKKELNNIYKNKKQELEG